MTPAELRSRRQALGLTQHQLADLLRIHRITITRWETGERDIIMPHVLALALDALFTTDTARAAAEQRWEKEKHVDTLLEAVLLLDDTLRSHLSAIHIDDDPDWPRTARLSVSLMIPGVTHATAGPYDITLDTTNMPDGVAVSSWTRWPDIIKPLTTDVPILEQVQQLQDSQLVGDLDVATFEPTNGPTLDHPARRYIIKPTVLPRQ